jgi:cardiolipin synthase A/B
MFRIRASASAVACVAAVALAVAGCKIDVPAAAGTASGGEAGQAGQSSDPGPTRSGPLIIEPGAGFSPVYGLINGARRGIDVTMYEFDDTTAERDLVSAARRGVDVRVILDEREQGVNSSAFSYFSSHRVKVVWSSSRFTYTHQKTLVIDGSRAIIMTANLTSEYYPTSRDFLVVDTDRADVAAITAVFDADYAHRAVNPGDGADLVWSPAGSQDKLLGLINGATSSLRICSLRIYSEEMGDTTVEDALIRAARRGVDVQICGENENGDYGTGHAKIFIGSENFSGTSLTDNRELGLIISDPAVLSAVARTFTADFRNGTHWT